MQKCLYHTLLWNNKRKVSYYQFRREYRFLGWIQGLEFIFIIQFGAYLDKTKNTNATSEFLRDVQESVLVKCQNQGLDLWHSGLKIVPEPQGVPEWSSSHLQIWWPFPSRCYWILGFLFSCQELGFKFLCRVSGIICRYLFAMSMKVHHC